MQPPENSSKLPPSQDYPRWMYHPSLDPVIVHSEEEEAALGPDWSRKLVVALPREEPGGTGEPVPPAQPARGRPPAHKRG